MSRYTVAFYDTSTKSAWLLWCGWNWHTEDHPEPPELPSDEWLRDAVFTDLNEATAKLGHFNKMPHIITELLEF